MPHRPSFKNELRCPKHWKKLYIYECHFFLEKIIWSANLIGSSIHFDIVLSWKAKMKTSKSITPYRIGNTLDESTFEFLFYSAFKLFYALYVTIGQRGNFLPILWMSLFILTQTWLLSRCHRTGFDHKKVSERESNFIFCLACIARHGDQKRGMKFRARILLPVLTTHSKLNSPLYQHSHDIKSLYDPLGQFPVRSFTVCTDLPGCCKRGAI